MVDQLEPRRLLALAVGGVDLTTDVPTRDGIEVTFTGPVDPASLDNDDLRVMNLTTGNVLGEQVPTLAAADRLRLTFADDAYLNPDVPVRLLDGYYELTIDADGLRDTDGNPLRADAAGTAFPAHGRYSSGTQLRHLNADFNGDGVVNISDYAIVRANFGRQGALFAEGDANGDGVVNISDYSLVRSRFGRSLEAPPTAAGEVLATLATGSTIDLSWVLPEGQVDAWHLYRGEGQDPDFGTEPVAILSNTDDDASNDFGATIGTDGVARGHFTDTDLVDGTLYHYDLRAWSQTSGLSPATDTAVEWTTLVAPDNLGASFLDNGQTLLEWHVGSITATHTIIEYQADTASPWLPAAVVHGRQGHWVVDALPGGVASQAVYSYRVKSEVRDASGDVVLETLFTESVTPTLAAPTGLAAVVSDPHGTDTLMLTWTRGGLEQTQHRIEVSSDAGLTWSAPATGDLAWAYGEDQTVGGLPDDRTYSVRVRGELVVYADDNDQNGSLVKASAWTTTHGIYLPVLAPTDVNATAVRVDGGSDGSIRIDWTNRTENASGYVVERRAADGVGWVTVAEVGPATETATDTPPDDARYVYRVSALPGGSPVEGGGGGSSGGSDAFVPGESEDRHDVATSDADGENVGEGGWGGNLGESDTGPVSIIATATEMNGGHAFIRVAAWTEVVMFPYYDLPGYASQAERDVVLSFAESLVGKPFEEEIRLGGETLWKRTTTVESVNVTDNQRVTLETSPPVIERSYGEGVPWADSGGMWNLHVKSSADRATAVVTAGGALAEALASSANTWFPSAVMARLVAIQPAAAGLSVVTDRLGVFVTDERIDNDEMSMVVELEVSAVDRLSPQGIYVRVESIEEVTDGETATTGKVRVEPISPFADERGRVLFRVHGVSAGLAKVTFGTGGARIPSAIATADIM